MTTLPTLQPQHYTVLILIMLSVSTQGQALHTWGEVFSVGFVFGTLLSVANTLYAAFVVDRPGGRKDVWDEAKRQAFRRGQGVPATLGTPSPPPPQPPGPPPPPPSGT